MGNMSYCQMENTANDLVACVESLEDALERGLTFEEFKANLSSDYERHGFDRLGVICQDFLEACDKLLTDPEDRWKPWD